MSNTPLAERLRPKTLDEYIGQEHLVGPKGVFRKFFETGNVPSFILWGPPGVGKTTLAKIVASQLERPFFTLSAVTSGVKEVREVIESARKQRFFDQRPPFLFIDEIHRFNKSQQDSLLGAVEQGIVHADRRHDRKPLLRGDLPAAEPLPGLYPPGAGGQGPPDAARPRPAHRPRTARTRNRGPGDRERCSGSRGAMPASCSTSSTSSSGPPTER